MMSIFRKILLASMLVSPMCYAENIHLNSLEIKFIRAVGDYSGSTYDNTIELWFTNPLVWPSSSCTDTRRVYVDSKHQHIISAAYTAFAANKKVNVHVDSTLPKRGGACEVSYLDILNN
nr:hypothetical protein [Vibrio nigripulchritudo]